MKWEQLIRKAWRHNEQETGFQSYLTKQVFTVRANFWIPCVAWLKNIDAGNVLIGVFLNWEWEYPVESLGGSCVENTSSFLLFYILAHEPYVESTREQFDRGSLIILWHSRWASDQCQEEGCPARWSRKEPATLVKENPRSNTACEKVQQENSAQHHKNLSLTMALALHDMLSERLGFWFEEISMFKQKAAHTAIRFISQGRCIWQCVLRHKFFPLVIWEMAFVQVWNYSHCNNFFSTFLMEVEFNFESYFYG